MLAEPPRDGSPAKSIAEIVAEPTKELVKPVAEIMAQYESRVKERGERWEQLSDSNWPEGRIQEALDREFPELRTAERIEQLENQQLTAQRRAKQSGLPQRKNRKTRRGLGPRQLLNADGPPPGVDDARKKY